MAMRLVLLCVLSVAVALDCDEDLLNGVCPDVGDVPGCEEPLNSELWRQELPQVGRKCNAGSYSLSSDGSERTVNSQHNFPVENAARVHRALPAADDATPLYKFSGRPAGINYWISETSYARTVHFLSRLLLWTVKVFLP